MSSLQFTSEDRDDQGRIIIRPATESVAGVPSPHRAPTPRQPAGWGRSLMLAGGFVLAAALIGLARTHPRSASPPVPASGPPDVLLAATTAPPRTWTPATATTSAHQMTHAVVVYDAPGGAVIGAIEPGRGYVPIARFGDDWVQLAANESGNVWVRRSDVYLDAADVDVLATLPDRAPPTPLPTDTPAPLPTAPPVPPTPIPPPPTACASNVYGVACGWGDVQATVDAIQAAAVATQAVQRATLAALLTPTPTLPPAQTGQ